MDTLQLAVSANAPTPSAQISTSGIETVTVTNNRGSAYSLDATLFDGVTSVTLTGGTGDTTVSNSKTAVNVGLVSINNAVTITPIASAVSATNDAVTVSLNGAAQSATVALTYQGIETMNISSKGAASGNGTGANDFRVNITDTALKTVNITGEASARLGITTSGATAVTEAGTIDGSKATGSLDLVVAAGTSTLLSVTTGSGDDRVNVGAITKEMTIAGGTGTDTLVVSAASKASSGTQPGANITGFEILEVASVGSVSMAAFPGTTFTSVSAKGTATLSDVGTAALTVNETPATAGGTLTITRATNGTGDTATINLNPTTSGTFTGLIVANEETLTISSGGDGANTVTTLTGTDLKSLTVSGTRGLTVTTLTGGTALATIDASANTGTVFFVDASASTVAMTVKGSGGAPTTAATTLNTITTGSGSDSVTGSAWADSITTGNGNDTVNAGAGNDTIDVGAGNDLVDAGEGENTVTGGSGNDSITAGAGNDVINAGSGIDTVVSGGGDDIIAVSQLSSGTVIDGGTGTDRVSASTGLDTSTSTTLVNAQFITVASDITPTLTAVEQLYLNATPTGTGQTTPLNINFSKAANVSTLWLKETAASATQAVKLTDFGGSTINLYGAAATPLSAAESQYLTIDGVGQAVTVNLHDYDAAAGGTLSATDVTTLTLVGRSTSQFSGNADQDNSFVAVSAASVDSIVVSTTGSSAANATAFATGNILATAASSLKVTSGTRDIVNVSTITANAGNLSSIELTAGSTGGGVAVARIDGGTAALSSVRIVANDSGNISTTGLAGGNPVDLDFTSAATLTVTANAGSTIRLDLTDEVVTAGTITANTGGTVRLGSTTATVLGLAGSASSYTISGGGTFEDFDAGATNTVSLLGTTVTFDVGGLTSATQAAYAVTSSATVSARITGNLGDDTLAGGSGNDSLVGGLGADSLTGSAGSDTIIAGVGADTVNGGAGNDSITLTENASSQGADVVQISAVVGTSSDSARVAVTGNNNDTGQDAITGFDFTNDTIVITATNVNNFVHTTDVVAGTATGNVDDGSVGSFTTSTLIVNLDKTAAVLGNDAGDVILTFSSSTSAGATATFAAASVAARMRYDLTGTANADTITGGALADTISGGLGADSLTGGAGADSIVLTESASSADRVLYSATTGTALLTEAGSAVGASATTAPATTTADSVTGFVSGTDKLVFSVALGTAAASGTLVPTGGTSYTTSSTGLAAADFVAIVVGGTMTALAANTAQTGRFLYDGTNGVLYYDRLGDTTMSTSGAFTAGASDDFVVATGITGLVATDIIFGP